jgi:hypothetical protein
MTPRWTNFLLPALLLLTPAFALAQTTDPNTAAVLAAQAAEAARQQYEAQRAALQQQAVRDKSIADMNNFLNGTPQYRSVTPSAGAELQSRFYEFRQSIPKFRAATAEYRIAVGMNTKLDKQLKDLSSQVDVMLRYLNLSKMKHPRPDPAEFKDYKQAELVWETLNTAEYISMYVDVAVAVEGQDVISAKMLQFMYELDGALLRLKWLTSHTKG